MADDGHVDGCAEGSFSVFCLCTKKRTSDAVEGLKLGISAHAIKQETNEVAIDVLWCLLVVVEAGSCAVVLLTLVFRRERVVYVFVCD